MLGRALVLAAIFSALGASLVSAQSARSLSTYDKVVASGSFGAVREAVKFEDIDYVLTSFQYGQNPRYSSTVICRADQASEISIRSMRSYPNTFVLSMIGETNETELYAIGEGNTYLYEHNRKLYEILDRDRYSFGTQEGFIDTIKISERLIMQIPLKQHVTRLPPATPMKRIPLRSSQALAAPSRRDPRPAPVRPSAPIGNRNTEKAYKSVQPVREQRFVPVEPVQQQPRQVSGERSHIVSEKETMFSIARAYGISVQALMERNQIEDKNMIYVGEPLIIPSR